MGRYLSANKTLKSYCKIRYTMSLLRKDHHLVKAPLYMNSHRHSQPLQPFRFAKKGAFKSDAGSTSSCFLRDLTDGTGNLHIVRFYSTSNRSDFKAEAPVGVFEEPRSSFHLNSLGDRLGQSFNRLSRHINLYFKKKDALTFAGNGSLVVTAAEYPGRSRRSTQHAAGERSIAEKKEMRQAVKCNKKEEKSEMPTTSTQEASRLQLFHISTLATRFGESYSYVAHHINSMFSQEFAEIQKQDHVESGASSRGTNRRHRRRKLPNTYITAASDDGPTQLSNHQASVESYYTSSSWEEGYLHFARHINKYFGAKTTNNVPKKGKQVNEVNKNNYMRNFSAQSASQIQQSRTAAPEFGGLFHSSSNATNFGENYMQMSHHINQYFKGESELDVDDDRNLLMDPGFLPSSEEVKAVSFMDCLRHPASAIPELLDSYLKLSRLSKNSKSRSVRTSPQAIINKKFILSRRQADEMTYGLMGNLRLASSPDALTACVEALNEHLIRYPSCKALIWQENTAVTLLKLRRSYKHHPGLQAVLRETLALIGYVDPVKGRGIRVLSIDGGGTRGVVPLQVLKLLEAETGKKIHQLFDYICGVSTGAVLAFMLGLAHFSLEECADMYRRFGSEVFRQNPLVGTVKMGWSHSYYNTETWEAILQKKLGDRLLITTARDELSPKVSAVSAVVNWGTSPKAFVFRNYNHTPGSLSRYAGGSGYQMWQAVRASSAAPGYFQEFTLQSDIHQDGGILLNNPCALAVHESRLLWPKQHFQCVLSLGTGRYDNAKRGPATSTSLRAKISNLICSATDTEGVHTLLDDLLAPNVYFRFNPMLSAGVSLDENRPGVMDQLQRDTQNYLERNRPKLARLCLVLGAERSAVHRTKDWMSERAWEMKHRFM
ncbi:calcium-independent phospholipase A2-gamma-like [Salarias fasciatus]|uniref:calcium-independent phospholipase A2-gamma-like n=1 Tax=Salarias fasciatus TaxID=181472 RepID=UPI001176C628|nr:calcium-independent phospholipase A2-gamma-like [Salarias fasciatus]